MRSNSAMRATEVKYSRRFLRKLDEAPGGNNLQYILKCPCIPFFGNQGLHNEIMLGGNGGHSRVMCEGSPYRNNEVAPLLNTWQLLPTPLILLLGFFSEQ